MKLLENLKEPILETQTNLETSLEDESQSLTWGQSSPRPPPRGSPDDCSNLYMWISVGVIMVATISVLVILVHFCRRNKGRRDSLEHIITSIELQNSTRAQGPVEPQRNFKVIRGENVKITVVERY